jgi:hypothetical protein
VYDHSLKLLFQILKILNILISIKIRKDDNPIHIQDNHFLIIYFVDFNPTCIQDKNFNYRVKI